MKLLHITSLYPSPCASRSGQAVRKLIDSIDCLPNMGISSLIFHCIPHSFFPVTLFDSEWKCLAKLRKAPLENNIRIISSIVFPRSKGRRFCAKNKAKHVHKEMKNDNFIPDIVHCHTAFTDGYSGYFLNQKYNIPYILTARREIDFQNNDLNDEEKCFTVKNILSSSITIVPSVHLKNKCLQHTGREAILVPNGIESELILSEEELTRKLNERENQLNIVTVASLDRNKRIDIVIRCFSKLLKEHGCLAHLDIVGSGPLEEDLRELARTERITSNVTFHRDVSRKIVMQILDKGDVFFLPSETETFGLAYLEALARGLPIIGRKNQGIDGVAKHGIHGFFENDIEGFYVALETLSKDRDLRNQMGENGVELAKNCTWEESGRKLLELYRNIKLSKHSAQSI